MVGARTLFLRDGEACRYEIGMGLEVIFTEQADGRVQRITPLEPRPALPFESTGRFTASLTRTWTAGPAARLG